MRFGKIASSFAAFSLLAAPVVVQAAPSERVSAPASEESELGGSVLWIALAIAAVIAAIVIIDDNNDPVSP